MDGTGKGHHSQVEADPFLRYADKGEHHECHGQCLLDGAETEEEKGHTVPDQIAEPRPGRISINHIPQSEMHNS